MALLVLVLLAMTAYVAIIAWSINSRLQKVDALSQASAVEGTTYLVAGSDRRGEGSVEADGTEGQRADSLLLIRKAKNGQAAVISLPRDTYVEIPGHGPNKLNAAFSFGGPVLTVATVEAMTGLKIDHYAEIGMEGVEGLVNAVGGVYLCYDQDVHDPNSQMYWQAGCHPSDGRTALAFSRMRYHDPRGDIGRTERQRQVISQLMAEVLSKKVILSPKATMRVADAGLKAVRVDHDASIFTLADMLLTMKKASKNGLQGTPPLASLNYQPGGVGSTVQLDPARIEDFWGKLKTGQKSTQDLQCI
ncbi:MAG: LCP family protein [Actinomycetaceae bacterium]|nr:LCP family protein [Actinomycetaceae bacterium]